MNRRQALRALEAHLEEAIGMPEAQAIVDDLERTVSRADLDEALREQTEYLTAHLTSVMRRDLVLILTGQFVALAGVLTAIT